MLPILETLDSSGIYSLEVWGGATFDACHRFLNENPWERLREIRKRVKNAKLQMLLRGQNLVGYRHYPDDIVEKFVQKTIENGLDVFRIFDALNDVRNLISSIKAAKKYDADHIQGTICYTISPVHTVEKYIEIANELAALEVDSICLKDMAGMLSPKVAYELVKALKKEVGLPINVHSHYTSGMASMALLKGVEAGAEMIDTCMSPLSGGTSHPPTESMVYALNELGYDTGVKLDVLLEARDYFMKIRENTTGSPQPPHSQFPTQGFWFTRFQAGCSATLSHSFRSRMLSTGFRRYLRRCRELGKTWAIHPSSHQQARLWECRQ